MKKILILLLIIVTGVYNVSAQSAKENYFAAQKAYNSKNYTKAIQYLDKVVQQLGSTNIRVQPLLIKALYNNKYYHRVLLEYDKYQQLSPNKELLEYNETVNLYNKSKENIKLEESKFLKAKSSSSVSLCDNFICNFPDSPRNEEIKAHKNILVENNYWEKVKSNNKESDYKSYLSIYPNGQYVSEANQKLKEFDSKAYYHASYKNTPSAYNEYLQNYPNGNYRNLAIKKRDKKVKLNRYMTRVREKPFILGYTYSGTIDSMKLNYPLGITVGKIFTSSNWNDYGFGVYASKKGYGYSFGPIVRAGLLVFKVGYGKGTPEYRYIDSDDHESGFEKIPKNELESMDLFDFQLGIRLVEFGSINFSVMGPLKGGGYSSLLGMGVDIMF